MVLHNSLAALTETAASTYNNVLLAAIRPVIENQFNGFIDEQELEVLPADVDRMYKGKTGEGGYPLYSWRPGAKPIYLLRRVVSPEYTMDVDSDILNDRWICKMCSELEHDIILTAQELQTKLHAVAIPLAHVRIQAYTVTFTMWTTVAETKYKVIEQVPA